MGLFKGMKDLKDLSQHHGGMPSIRDSFKDIGKLADDPHQATTVAVGEGSIDWRKVIGTAHANGVKHYFYEQEEPYTRPVMESARMSADYLSKLSV